MSAPFVFQLRQSKALMLASISAHLLVVGSVVVSKTPSWVMVFVLACVVVSIFWQWRRKAYFSQLSVRLTASQELWLLTPATEVQVEILPGSVDLAWLIVLHWRVMESPRQDRVALTREAFSSEDWRALRRFLRWHRASAIQG
ncbi:protein YgfX [Uliginosibacterium sp. 31-16]|uniref:protein YgfX n=1 Tax=Uliginosibacterium sp. 31-16 TaxID=3068315 RepID=UPI003531CBEB